MTETRQPLSPRMAAIADAAVRVIARAGLRGMTHRAVDAEAGLPEGSTSSYLRTRLALLTAAGERVVSLLEARIAVIIEAVEAGVDEDEIVEDALDLFVSWLDEPELLMVRGELMLEAVRVPDVAAVMHPLRRRLVELVAHMLTRLQTPEPELRAPAILAAIEGVLSAALEQEPQDRADYVRRVGRTIIQAFRTDEPLMPGSAGDAS
ncbi:TetR/AcrR family transcriptional regulator [Marihabitans asiaticum]|uniref:TetR family transcriptional regulator n=1 Tax=Marihabitans asiaticum TaxID=415218 RepID=A0A560WDB8_9MICO|nr:TetR family transcriptional regulator [Marihabitans asiaticum]TWD15628.1 TetR family transcriptional regulator [Marihabitans asiaticum]